MDGWHEYTREACPICGHKGWCGGSDDGVVVHCMRVESQKACPGGGWIHFIKDRPEKVWVRKMPTRPKPKVLDMAVTMAQFRAEFECGGGGGATQHDIFDSLIRIGEDLKLRPADIDRLEVGRSQHYQAWAFPMRDAVGKVIGVRLRRYGSSEKWSVSGSADGLFFDPALEAARTVVHGIRGREITVVEGATDCIAGYQLGLACVGRSSCATGGALLRSLCTRLNVTRVTIVTDNDNYKRRPSGMPWRPGLDGAKRLATQIGRLWRIVTPPKKDLREWLYAGCTPELFNYVAGLQPWHVVQ